MNNKWLWIRSQDKYKKEIRNRIIGVENGVAKYAMGYTLCI